MYTNGVEAVVEMSLSIIKSIDASLMNEWMDGWMNE